MHFKTAEAIAKKRPGRVAQGVRGLGFDWGVNAWARAIERNRHAGHGLGLHSRNIGPSISLFRG